LEYDSQKNKKMIADTVKIVDSQIIEPCYIEDDVVLINSNIGPYVSIGKGTVIENSNIEKSLIQNHNSIVNADIKNSMIGSHVKYDGNFEKLNLGDYSSLTANES